MKKSIPLLAVSLLFAIGMVEVPPLIAQEKEWSLVGTWVNPAYENTNVYLPKIVYGNDNTISIYFYVNDKAPFGVGNYEIEKDWTESGVHWFMVKSIVNSVVYYELDRLTEGGDKYEGTISHEDYPTNIDITSSSYQIRKRQ